MHRAHVPAVALVLCLLLAAPLAWADVTLNGIFTDNMVLQREMPVAIYGKADPGEQVTVTIGDQSKAATAGEDGKWKVTFEPLAVEGAFEVKAVGNNEIVLTNVVLGDVWVCSGQSNMAFTVGGVRNAPEEIAAADYPDLRLFNFARKASLEPTDEVGGQWVPCSSTTVRGFSAVGYFFGRKLHQELGVPIGLINTSWGGTPAQAWTSLEKLQADPEYAGIFEQWEQMIAAWPEAMRKYNEETIPAWEKKVEEAKAAGETPPRKPRPPAGPDSPSRPANLFNGMIYPLIPFAIKGATWYQGEANARAGVCGAWQYRKLLSDMITDWRDRWGQSDFPFLIVQLANYTKVVEQPGEAAWAELRESQLLTALNTPGCGLAVTIDVGEGPDIHPKDKQTVGLRLALWALGTTYGRDTVYSGPIYKSMDVEGNKIRLHFDHVGGGLTMQANENAPDPSKLVGFQIAGEDEQWVWANASIDGDTVVVTSDAVPAPVAVRYAWAANPICNLYNAEGLPASPFRTDDWLLSTQPEPEQ